MILKFLLSLFISFLVIFGNNRLIAQNKKIIDSLQVVYKNAKQDTTRIWALADIASQYYPSKPDTFIIIHQKVLEESQKSNFLRGQRYALSRIGVGHYLKGEYEKALLYYGKEYKICLETKDLKKQADNLRNGK